MIIPGVVASASRPVPTVTTGSATNTTAAPTVTTSAATNYNQNSATLNGSTSIGSLSYKYGTSNPPSTASGSSLSSLSNGTTYYFRAVGTNNSGTATLSGTVSTSLSTTVDFQWGTSSGSYPNTATYGSVGPGDSLSVSVGISGLSPGTTYYFRIRALTSTGAYVYGSESSFTAVSASAEGSVLSFTTYSQRTVSYTSTGSGTWTNPVPNSGTSGLAITEFQDVLVVGGGGGSEGQNGGGGGAVVSYNSISISGNVSYTVGIGGTPQGNGGTSSLGGVSAPGGQNGDYNFVFWESYRAGSSGNGYLGGFNQVDYPYLEPSYVAGGGGGGASEAGYSASGGSPGSGGSGIGGRGGGGAGYTPFSGGLYGYAFDGGGSNSSGAANTGGGASGGSGFSGGSGYITFKYWGP